MNPPKVKKSTIAINWIHRHVRVPDGKYAGRPIKLAGFQKRFIRDVYDNPAVTRSAILSVGRKNAKTATTAMLMLLHLCGPFAKQNSQLYSIANTRDQASILYRMAVAMLLQAPTLLPHVKITDSKKLITVPKIGNTYQALSADATGSKTQGYSPIWFCADEIGQTRGPSNKLFDAMMTGQAAHEAPLAMLISTQAEQDGDLLSILIDDALAGNDPKTICHLYHAPPDADPWSESALIAANPAWDDFINQDELRHAQSKAKRMPSFEVEFLNKHLNRRIEKSEQFIAREIWQENSRKPECYKGKKVYIGLDLSSTRDLTAMSIIHRNDDDQSVSVNMRFWLPEYAIGEKERLDRVPYQTWEKQGLLSLTPGKSVEYGFVAAELWKIADECDVQVVSFDRWNLKYFKQAMLEQGIPDDWIERTFKPFGQGFQSMSPAIRNMESLILNGDFHHGENPILTWNMRNIKIVRDPAGNRKFEKVSGTRRIDGAVAAVMAIGSMNETEGDKKPKSYLETGPLLVL